MSDPPKLKSLEKPPHHLLAKVRTGDWLNQQVFPPLEFAVPGIIPEGSNIIAGPPKVGKSWLVLGIGLKVAAGDPVLGSIELENSRPVLMFALEDSDRRVQERSSVLHGSLPSKFSYLLEVDPSKLIDTMKTWLHENGHEKPLIIIDTLGKAVPPSTSNESAYQRDYRIGSELKSAVDEYPGSSLLIVHHTRKEESEDFVGKISGTNGLTGSADTTITLKRDRMTDEGLLSITGRDVEESEVKLIKADTKGWILDPTQTKNGNIKLRAQMNLGDSKKDLLDFIYENHKVTTAQCTEKFGTNARYYLSQLTKANKIQKTGRGEYRAAS